MEFTIPVNSPAEGLNHTYNSVDGVVVKMGAGLIPVSVHV